MAAVPVGLLLGAIGLGALHGIEPGHGWPVAATYALDRGNKWLAGFAAGLVIGVGHLVSSIAMVAAFFYAKSYFELTQVNEPITVVDGVTIGGPVSVVAGLLLLVLGIREYRHGHSHGFDDGERHDGHGQDDCGDHDHSHDHEDDHSHDLEHADEGSGLRSRLAGLLPFGGGHQHHSIEEGADRGILGIAWFAFVLGFAHEEEFEIIALCAGSAYCLELMTVYALTVIVGILSLTLLLIAGYHRFEERVERYTPYLPAFSAAVLSGMGVGFVLGVF